jgi:hypothetical protein
MTALSALWLPILLSAVLVFVASSVIHMVFTGWHASDYRQIPNEDQVRAALQPLAIPPGDYVVPRPASAADMRSPDFVEKVTRGPVMILTVLPNRVTNMGQNLLLWFLYSAVVSLFAGYVTSRAVAPGAPYLEVFRFAGVTAFTGYALALWQMSIWYRRDLGTTMRSTIDGFVYALLTAGVFGWLWPA